MDFDLSKENIQPLRGGRNVAQLEVALQAQNSAEYLEELMLQKQAFENLIRTYEGNDPLQNYFNYISWVEQSYPKHGHEGNLVPVLEDCIKNFESDKRYKNDRRFCKIWIKFIDLQQNPLELYQMLYARDICKGLADFYKAWAYYHEAVGDFRNADIVFQTGIRELAQPYDDLIAAHQNMIFAAGQQLISGVDERRLQEQRQALTTLRTYRPGHVSSVRTASSFGPGVLPSTAAPMSSKHNTVFPIFEHNGETSLGAAAGPVSVLAAISRDAPKENLMKPGTWTSAAMKKGHVGAPKAAAFQVHEDSEEVVPPHIKGIQLPKNFHSVSRDDFSNWKCDICTPDPDDPTKFPMYCKRQVYMDPTTESSIEEVRARRYQRRLKSRLSRLNMEVEQGFQNIMGGGDAMDHSMHEAQEVVIYQDEEQGQGIHSYQQQEPSHYEHQHQREQPQFLQHHEQQYQHHVQPQFQQHHAQQSPFLHHHEQNIMQPPQYQQLGQNQQPQSPYQQQHHEYQQQHEQSQYQHVQHDQSQFEQQHNHSIQHEQSMNKNATHISQQVQQDLEEMRRNLSHQSNQSYDLDRPTKLTNSYHQPEQHLFMDNRSQQQQNEHSSFLHKVLEQSMNNQQQQHQQQQHQQQQQHEQQQQQQQHQQMLLSMQQNELQSNASALPISPQRHGLPKSLLEDSPQPSVCKQDTLLVSAYGTSLWNSPSPEIENEVSQLAPKQHVTKFAVFEESNAFQQEEAEVQPKASKLGSAMKTPFKIITDDDLAETGSRGGLDSAAAAQPCDGAKRLAMFDNDDDSSTGYGPAQNNFDLDCSSTQIFNLNAMHVSTPQNKPTMQFNNIQNVASTKKQLFSNDLLSVILEEKSQTSTGSSTSGGGGGKLKQTNMSTIEEESKYHFNLAQNMKANEALRSSLLGFMDCDTQPNTPTEPEARPIHISDDDDDDSDSEEFKEYVPQTPLTIAPTDPFKAPVIQKLLQHVGFPGRHRQGYVTLHNTPRMAVRKEPCKVGDEKYLVEKKLGTGTFGSVFKATRISTGETVALKHQKPPNRWEYYICREIRDRLIHHPLRARFMDIHIGYFNDQVSLLQSDFSPYGSLLDAANGMRQKTGRTMSEMLILHFSIDMLNIVKTLHEAKIIHADIKPDNFLVIMLDSKTAGLQLIDFGCSIDMSLYPEGTTFTRRVNTEDFICCEMLDGRPWSYHTDLFCVAASTHVLLFDKYIQLKKEDGAWSLSSKMTRYRRADLWNIFFGTLLNMQNGLPDIQDLTSTIYYYQNEQNLANEMRDFANFIQHR